MGVPPTLAPDEGDRSSVTDVNGSIARFDMSYSPPPLRGKVKFGAPLGAWLLSAGYLVLAIALGGLALYAYTLAPTSSWLFRWIVEGDRGRPLPANVLATIVVVSALGTVLRTYMRGVLVSDDSIEARYLLALGIPRTRRWTWPQINRIVVGGSHVALELWDGTFARLPRVRRPTELASLLSRHARRRKIDITVLDQASV